MRIFVSDLIKDRTLFIGDFDSYSVIKYHFSVDRLLLLTKVALLLYDRILLPAAFFWQSEEMAQLLMRLELPIAKGDIIPVIRDSISTNDVLEYFAIRVDESKRLGPISVFSSPEIASELADTKHIKTVQVLKDINTVAHLDRKSVRSTFIKNWEADLYNHTDVNSLRLLLYQSNQRIEQIHAEITELLQEVNFPQFSRASCIEKVQSLTPVGRLQEKLKERITWLYLKSTAESYNSDFFYSINPYNRMLSSENLLLLMNTLEVFGLSKKTINQLSIADILQIRNSTEYFAFISKYRELLEVIYCKQSEIETKLKERIVHEICKENVVSKAFHGLKILQASSATVFLSLLANYFSNSTINTTALVASGAFATIPVVLKHFEIVNFNMQTTAFSSFKQFVIAEQYRCRINKMIGEC